MQYHTRLFLTNMHTHTSSCFSSAVGLVLHFSNLRPVYLLMLGTRNFKSWLYLSPSVEPPLHPYLTQQQLGSQPLQKLTKKSYLFSSLPYCKLLIIDTFYVYKFKVSLNFIIYPWICDSCVQTQELHHHQAFNYIKVKYIHHS